MTMSTCSPERRDHDIPRTEEAVPYKDIHLGLQICRANSLSLTRLQLALRKGDRRSVLEAMDRLHDLDAQIGRLLQRLPISANDDLESQAIGRYIDEQRMAVAFERLALVSQVSGPDMLSPTDYWGAPDRARIPGGRSADQAGPPFTTHKQFSPKMLGLVIALFALAAVACLIFLSSGA
ncbi:hypothetical protein [Novosphingobium sp. BL-8H]|uniref:hypothetical protein n=1 Tax=Novosphingobium sp. BL-8H TaxID=3127640 RepID=UPI003757049B